MPDIFRKFIGSLVRSGLLALGGVLVAHGWLDKDASPQFVEALSGAIMTLGSLGWSLWEKYHTRQIINTSLLPGVTTLDQARALVAAPGLNPSVLAPTDSPPQLPEPAT